MAVRLEKGSHEILFVYRNVSFYIGVVLSLTILFAIVLRSWDG